MAYMAYRYVHLDGAKSRLHQRPYQSSEHSFQEFGSRWRKAQPANQSAHKCQQLTATPALCPRPHFPSLLDQRAGCKSAHLAAGHRSLHHIIRLGFLPSDLFKPFWRVWVDLRDLNLRLLASFLRHGFYTYTGRGRNSGTTSRVLGGRAFAREK